MGASFLVHEEGNPLYGGISGTEAVITGGVEGSESEGNLPCIMRGTIARLDSGRREAHILSD